MGSTAKTLVRLRSFAASSSVSVYSENILAKFLALREQDGIASCAKYCMASSGASKMAILGCSLLEAKKAATSIESVNAIN